MFRHDPLPSCKFLYCFYSLSQAGESQAESEILFSLYDSRAERRNNNANIHLKEVTVWYRLKLSCSLSSKTGISSAHLPGTSLILSDHGNTLPMQILLNTKRNAIQPPTPTPKLSPAKQIRTWCQKAAVFQGYQFTGREGSPQAFKEQVTEKLLLVLGLRPICTILPSTSWDGIALETQVLPCSGFFSSDSRKPVLCKIIINLTKPHGLERENWGRKVVPLIQNKPSSSHRRYHLRNHRVNELSLHL